jgi:hypothetical protein
MIFGASCPYWKGRKKSLLFGESPGGCYNQALLVTFGARMAFVKQIPITRPIIGVEEKQAVLAVLDSVMLVAGEKTRAFE